ncbi:MAG: hypothetical protein HY904_06840 [Deltaproteobacteria bacterium]|nr:hypothetical protein [Deltaproteobacteria bacterium]
MRHALVALVLVLCAAVAEAAPRKAPRRGTPPAKVRQVPAAPAAAPEPFRHGAIHVEFGAHDVTGQAARPGEVRIVERVEVPVRSLLRLKPDLRTRVLGTVE